MVCEIHIDNSSVLRILLTFYVMTKVPFDFEDLNPTSVASLQSENKTIKKKSADLGKETTTKTNIIKKKLKETVEELMPYLIQTKKPYIIYVNSPIDKRAYKFRFELIRISK
jgi:hypothetical protein